MKRLSVTLLLSLVLACAVVLLTRKEDPPREAFARGQEIEVATPQREHVSLEAAVEVAEAVQPADIAREPETARADVVDSSLRWQLLVDVSGFTPWVDGGVPLIASALGDDAQLELELSGDGFHEFDVTELRGESRFFPPSLNVLVDHEEYFLWDETIEAVVEEGVAYFEAKVALEPLLALVSGSVSVPRGHDDEVMVGLFTIDEETGFPHGDALIHVGCDPDGGFALRAADPGECFLVANAPGLRPETQRLEIHGGETRDDVFFQLRDGHSIDGVISVDGQAPPEGTQVRVIDGEDGLYLSAARRRAGSWRLPHVHLAFDESAERFVRTRSYTQTGPDGRFSLSGLEEREYSVFLDAPHSPAGAQMPLLELGSHRAPARGVHLRHERIPVELQFRRDGKELILRRIELVVELSANNSMATSLAPPKKLLLPSSRSSELHVQTTRGSYQVEVDPRQADANGLLVVELD